VRSLLRLLFLAAGLASVGYLVAAAGVEALLGPVRTLSWRVAVFVVFPYAVVALLHTLAWGLAFARRPVSLARLFSVRLAGEALNLAAASVGGEPVKALLLRSSVPLVEASAAQVVDKTGITVGQVAFLALGLATALAWLELPLRFLQAMGALLAIQIVVVIAFVLVQNAGVFGRALRILEWFGVRDAGGHAQGLVRLDRALATSYRDRPGRAIGCVLVHLAGWITNSLEVYLVLWWLGVGGSFVDALVIDAFGTGVKFMAFAIPGALGALEGGYMVAFGALGFGSGLGLSFTLIRRLRMVGWSALGVLLLALLREPARALGPETAP
jgi:uncharacterized protein (TIRG00374 family)